MKCNNLLMYATISIILIIGIIILILYKTHNDNKYIEGFDCTTNPTEGCPTTTAPTTTAPTITNPTTTAPTITNPTATINLSLIENSIIGWIKIINEKINNTPSQTLYIPDNNQDAIDTEFQSNVTNTTLPNNIDSIADSIVNNISPKITAASNRILQLENTLTDLENTITNINNSNATKTIYTKVKSLNNGMEMDLFNTTNSSYIDPKSGSNTSAYLVSLNKGCLSVGATDYDVNKCNDNNVKQYFKLENIFNDTQYANNIDNAFAFDNIDKTKINYPFTMIKSVNTENCLTNNHGNITVQPCMSFKAQRWMAM